MCVCAHTGLCFPNQVVKERGREGVGVEGHGCVTAAAETFMKWLQFTTPRALMHSRKQSFLSLLCVSPERDAFFATGHSLRYVSDVYI